MIDSDPRNLDLDPNLIGDIVNEEVFGLQDAAIYLNCLLNDLLGIDRADAPDYRDPYGEYRVRTNAHISLLEDIGLDANRKYSLTQIIALHAAIKAALDE